MRETRVSYHARFMHQIRALEGAGARITLLTSNPDRCDAPAGVKRVLAPLDRSSIDHPHKIPASQHPLRFVRIASNLVRNAARWGLTAAYLMRQGSVSRARALRRLAPRTDLFWVVDYPGLPSTCRSAERWGNGRVLYDTIDLVPEYTYAHISEEQHRTALDTERALIPSLTGFVTAAESYADYYDEAYGDIPGYRRPAVFGNAPDAVVDSPKNVAGGSHSIPVLGSACVQSSCRGAHRGGIAL